MRKRVMVILTALMVFMSVAATAFAADETTDVITDQGTDTSVDAAGTIITRSGVLWAFGKGKAVLHGGGKVRMAIAGNVTIVDYAGDARVWIGGHPSDDPNAEADARLDAATTYDLDNFRGLIVVKGSNFKIKAFGKMKFKAKGHGSAFLKGKGRWHTRGTAGNWLRSGLRIRYGVAL